MSELSKRLKQRVSELKKSEGLTQKIIAERLNVTPSTVGHWLAGRREPRTLSDYERLSKILRVSANWIMHGTENAPIEKKAVFVPILGHRQVNSWFQKEKIDITSNKSVPIEDIPGARRFYAIKVTDSGLSPRIEFDDLAIIDPDQKAILNNTIAVDFKDNGVLSLGVLKNIGPDIVLSMHNTTYPVNELTKCYRGTVKQVISIY